MNSAGLAVGTFIGWRGKKLIYGSFRQANGIDVAFGGQDAQRLQALFDRRYHFINMWCVPRIAKTGP
jgi:hypothetical protein